MAEVEAARFSDGVVTAIVSHDDSSDELTKVQFSGNLGTGAFVSLKDGAWEFTAYASDSQPVSIATGHGFADTTINFKAAD